jgi:hypothetical protein
MTLLPPLPEAVQSQLHAYLTEEEWVIVPLVHSPQAATSEWMETLPLTHVDRDDLVLLSEALRLARQISLEASDGANWDSAPVAQTCRRRFALRWYEGNVAALTASRPASVEPRSTWVRILSREWNNAGELQIARHLIEQSAWVGPHPPTDAPRRPQRRAHYRHPMHMPVQFCPLRSFAAYESSFTDWPDSVSQQLRAQGQPGQVEDLSSGGLRMRVTEPLKAGDALYLELNLWNHPFRSTGQVRRSQPSDDHNWQVGVQFVGLESQYKEQVAQFLFDQQHRL